MSDEKYMIEILFDRSKTGYSLATHAEPKLKKWPKEVKKHLLQLLIDEE